MFRKHWKIGAIAAAGLLLAAAVLMLLTRESPDEADRIYTNVYIHGVNVGGLLAGEANFELERRFQPGLEALTVSYTVDGAIRSKFTFADYGARFDFAPLIEAAFDYTFSPAFSTRVARLFRERFEINDAPLFVFSAERLEDVMLALSAELDTPARNAKFYEENGEIHVAPESPGYGIDTEAAALATRQLLQSLEGGIVELQMIHLAPLHTKSDFDFKPGVIGSHPMICGCARGEPARCRNIRRASERVHNTVLFPGEVFSASEVIAVNSPEAGYEPAPVMLQGETVDDIGGGVCMVVTALYNAALRSELEIIQRHNHSAQVGYVEPGFDATVAGDYYDLKFKNNTAHPVLITSKISGNRLEVRIHGKETRESRRVIRFEARQIETLEPEPCREIVDPALPIGARQVVRPPQSGYHVELFKIIYKNGSLVEEVKVNTSIYKPQPGTIAIGAG